MNQGCWKVDENDEVLLAKDRHHNFSKTLYTKLYSSKNTGSKAIYIDLDNEDSDDDENKEYSMWSELPDLLLEKIFAFLNIREKYYASLVCKSWYRAFHLPYVWSRFILEDNTLTRSRFNYYSGWQLSLKHVLSLRYVSETRPKTFYGKEPKPLLQKPHFMQVRSETIYHTNYSFYFLGKLLQAIKRLMGNLKRLENLHLIDLMLDPKEAQYLLDEVCESQYLTLKTLFLINTTKVQYQLLHVGVFLNLKELHISPQNLGDDLIELLGNTKLKHLHIVQNRYTSTDVIIIPVSPDSWKKCRKENTGLSVHLHLQSMKEKPLIWQQGAPVRSLVYDSPHIGVSIVYLNIINMHC
uniref:F-box/LRR-repeat protein 21-like n=1 Tax=Diabrotica virgifera virgifera TaxID=50390 RepID=A0A6P7GNS7_DIAVI